jgi:gluconate 2-dehydrogenase gamma chain
VGKARKAGTLLTRRELLKQAGLAGAAAAIVPTTAIAPAHAAPAAVAGQAPGAAAITREPLEALTPAEADVLEAICARLIPTDANGPGATEARAAHYIDRALAGFLAPNRQAYAAGLAAIDRHAITSHGAAFSRLEPADQDAVLKDVEAGKADGLPSGFFALVRTHTIQGTFCDPFYGGNANFVGWDLLGYPGVRTIVTADEQRMGITLTPNHRSAYDYAMFNKATAGLHKREHEGRGLEARDSGLQDSGGSRGHGDPA